MTKQEQFGTYQFSELKPLNIGQLKQLIDDVDDDKSIRIWVESKNSDEKLYFEGRVLVGMTDEENLCCFCAAYERHGDNSD